MKIDPNILRKKVIDMVVAKQSGHIGGAFSMAELTSVLYEDYDIGGKDKLILSNAKKFIIKNKKALKSFKRSYKKLKLNALCKICQPLF